MQLAGEHQDEIDMLISNVQMPGMSGQALAETSSGFGPTFRSFCFQANLKAS